jgi:hypothetical protein
MTSDRRSLGRKNPIVISTWTEQQCLDKWMIEMVNTEELDNSVLCSPFSSCHIWKGSTQNGYPSVSQGHAKSKIKMHILSAWTRQRRVPLSNEVVSHLCNRKLCINPNHLVIESIKTNNSRVGCVGYMIDFDNNIWQLCPHDKPCLRSDSENNKGFQPFVKLNK